LRAAGNGGVVVTDRLPDFRPRFSTTWAPPISATQRLEDERDAARNDLAAAERRIAHLEAVNAVLAGIFADALGRTLPETAPTERTPR
jgi:hypothetical protein